MKTKNFIFLLAFLIIHNVALSKNLLNVIPGANNTESYFPLLKGKTVAVVANQTSVISGVHLIDTLLSSGIHIKCVFAPEHGFRGESGAGEHIKNDTDKATGVRIVSLYGKYMKPTTADLKGVDILVFDIQDVGVRFYTYISTLQYVMESCAENHVELIVLDRPNPHGFYIDGPVLEKPFTSFIGMQQIPVVYGMTIGEYAGMLNGEGWLKKKRKCKLKVIPVRNYNHFANYLLPISPSPNLNGMEAVYLYPSICFFEGTRVSLGRGTQKPFRLIGYPGSVEGDTGFTPVSLQGMSVNPPYRDTLCTGMDLTGKGLLVVEEKKINLGYLLTFYKSYPQKDKFFTTFFDKLAGTTKLREDIIAGKNEDEIRKSWQPAITRFKIIRKKYLLYKDFEQP